ncbi:MAG: sigma-70 family RNA polymerase sigma factor [Crocinitomicaceae bacterium]|nr:sigma-70 family RNA polymerase sigma factor [Crocinitomicaceae bacterium]
MTFYRKTQQILAQNKEPYQNDDSALVVAAQKDRNAFAAIYDKYFDRIYLFIYKRVGDEQLAGDICQETMLKVMMNIHKYEDRGLPFSAWLYRIASNEVNLYYRGQKKNTTVEIQEKHLKELMHEGHLGKIESEEDQEKLIQMLSRLKPEYTEIIELRFFMEYSFKEIAEFYNITEANAKMRLYRIFEKMKDDWK